MPPSAALSRNQAKTKEMQRAFDGEGLRNVSVTNNCQTKRRRAYASGISLLFIVRPPEPQSVREQRSLSPSQNEHNDGKFEELVFYLERRALRHLASSDSEAVQPDPYLAAALHSLPKILR